MLKSETWWTNYGTEIKEMFSLPEDVGIPIEITWDTTQKVKIVEPGAWRRTFNREVGKKWWLKYGSTLKASCNLPRYISVLYIRAYPHDVVRVCVLYTPEEDE